MRTKPQAGALAISLFLSFTLAGAQTPQGSGEIIIPPHWSPYKAPDRFPEGTKVHIIVRGDTLWDLSQHYLNNPFLWPQLWDANRYILNANLIYPGDPVVIPPLELIRGGGEAGGGVEPGAPGGEQPVGEAAPTGPGGPKGPSLYPVSEEISVQCAGYITENDKEQIRIIGSEEGDAKVALATHDIVYLSRGGNDGVNAGDQYYVQRKVRKIQNPANGDKMGWLVTRSGWLTVLAVQENTAIAEVTQACIDVLAGDYLLPFEQIPVPLVLHQKPATRLDPETGKTRGHIVASHDDIDSLAQGSMVSVDVGEEQGIIPGNVFTIFRSVYPDVPTPRKIIGELAVLTVQRRTATAKITYSAHYVVVGDAVELK